MNFVLFAILIGSFSFISGYFSTDEEGVERKVFIKAFSVSFVVGIAIAIFMYQSDIGIFEGKEITARLILYSLLGCTGFSVITGLKSAYPWIK